MMEFREEVGLLLDDLVDEPATETLEMTSEDRAAGVIGPVPIAKSEDLLPAFKGEQAGVLCIGARTYLDTAAAEILARSLSRHGIRARSASVARLSDFGKIDLAGATIVWLCSIDEPVAQAHMRFLIRHVRRSSADITICAGFWRGAIDGSRSIGGIEEIAQNITSAVLATVRLATAPQVREEVVNATRESRLTPAA